MSLFASGIVAQNTTLSTTLSNVTYTTITKTTTLTKYQSTSYIYTTASPTALQSCHPAVWAPEDGDYVVRNQKEGILKGISIKKRGAAVVSTRTTALFLRAVNPPP
ncbi:hypothetical protein G7Y89_g15217 [Cudoniella acicularis]|uniref:Uncharacterized protein n=1 Tax=Cudoniella acicularis TaxID=354080 RepID=A0A8H4QRP9_9HELO|nr:hypothetical protein G7Y89_g15217 [Cudoniella acicularis]